MEFAFLDESGDLGKDSKYLVLTLMCTKKVKQITQIVRKIKQKLLQKNKCAKWLNQHGGEIKFYGFPDKHILKKLLTDLSNVDMHIYFLCFEKGGIKVNQDVKPTILGQLFMHSFQNSEKHLPEKVIADLSFFNKDKINYFVLQKYEMKPVKTKGKDGNDKKCHCLEVSFSRIEEKEYNIIKDKDDVYPVRIEHKNSRQSEPLQAIDIISGCIFSKFEKEDSECFDLLSKGKLKLIGNMFGRKSIKK